jgi:PAS domain S-box-containing protein
VTDQPVASGQEIVEFAEGSPGTESQRAGPGEELRQYRILAGNETDFVWTMDLNSRITSATAPARHLLAAGDPPSDPGRLGSRTLSPPNHGIFDHIFAEIQEMATTRIKDSSGSWVVDMEIIGRDGTAISTETSVSPLYGHNGQPCGVVCITRDLTDRRHQQDLFRTLADSSPIGVYILQDSIFKFVNYQFERYAGYSQTELIGAEAMNFVVPEDRDKVRQSARAMLKGERTNPYEFRFIDKQGRTRWVMESVASIHHACSRATLGSFMDISELKRAEGDLRNSEAQLRLLTQRIFEIQEEERARFARDLHDELGQDIVFLKIKAESLTNCLRDAPGLHEQAAELVEVAERLKTTARRIAVNVGPGLLDSMGLVRAVEWYGEEFERRTGMSCPVDAPQDDIPMPRATALTAYRILQEALTNVWKHSGASQVCLKIERDRDSLLLHISDNGVGIGLRRLKTGPSLGLLGMTERARLAGGTLRVSSQAGKGTELVLRLPISLP